MIADPPMPVVTGAQMAAVDRAIVDFCGLELMQVMEVAGRSVAVAVRALYPSASVAILCGSGGNGGDGFVCARYLAGWEYEVQCWLDRPAADLGGLAAHQLQICQQLGIPLIESDEAIDFTSTKVIVDGLFGFGLTSAPRGHAVRLIEGANHARRPLLSIDIPSGLDATTGTAHAPTVRADVTLTLALPKLGLLTGDGPQHAGQVIVADIGIPAAAYAAVGIAQTSIFNSAEFVTLDGRPWTG
jgi:NAD(P)H-hydrate epimerase